MALPAMLQCCVLPSCFRSVLIVPLLAVSLYRMPCPLTGTPMRPSSSPRPCTVVCTLSRPRCPTTRKIPNGNYCRLWPRGSPGSLVPRCCRTRVPRSSVPNRSSWTHTLVSIGLAGKIRHLQGPGLCCHLWVHGFVGASIGPKKDGIQLAWILTSWLIQRHCRFPVRKCFAPSGTLQSRVIKQQARVDSYVGLSREKSDLVQDHIVAAKRSLTQYRLLLQLFKDTLDCLHAGSELAAQRAYHRANAMLNAFAD
mmetsp:Transcript_31709/g.90984  ORF Transcript_31709/g.90984 Transcript_31709/m.90984 type:complete len:253 (-) Transcript_31709:296-1054(-)